MASSPEPSKAPASPIDELQQIVAEAGEDVAKIFGMALTTFAGPLANTKSPEEKDAELERLIRGGDK